MEPAPRGSLAAQTLAGHQLADPVLGGRVQALLAELKQDDNDRRMVARLEEIRLQLLKPEVAYWSAAGVPSMRLPSGSMDCRLFDLAVEEAGAAHPTSAIRDWLVAALDDCARNDGSDGAAPADCPAGGDRPLAQAILCGSSSK